MQVMGMRAGGVAALGSSCIAVGLHTGEVVLFTVSLKQGSYSCSVVGRYRSAAETQGRSKTTNLTKSRTCICCRQHLSPLTDLASSSTALGPVLATGDLAGVIHLWRLAEPGLQQYCKVRGAEHDHSGCLLA